MGMIGDFVALGRDVLDQLRRGIGDAPNGKEGRLAVQPIAHIQNALSDRHVTPVRRVTLAGVFKVDGEGDHLIPSGRQTKPQPNSWRTQISGDQTAVGEGRDMISPGIQVKPEPLNS